MGFVISHPPDQAKKISPSDLFSLAWLGMRDSNPRMSGPEPDALPLGESPTDVIILALLFGFVYTEPSLRMCLIINNDIIINNEEVEVKFASQEASSQA